VRDAAKLLIVAVMTMFADWRLYSGNSLVFGNQWVGPEVNVDECQRGRF
jgi:hypothetical protein